MSEKKPGPGRDAREAWAGWPLRLVIAGTVYLVATGLIILLAPFGIGAQVTVLAHTVLGLVFMVPLVVYLCRHLAQRFRDKFSHLLLLGWMAGLLMLAVAVSGVVLTVQAAFGRRIDYGWDLVHTVTGCAVGVIILAHLLTAVRRGEGRPARRLLGFGTAAGVLLTVATFLGGEGMEAAARRQPLPENYSFRYGKNPFAPSMARTDLLWRVEQDRVWERFLDDPAHLTPVGIGAFVEVATRQLQSDRASLARGGRTDAERIEGDAQRIKALKAYAANRDDKVLARLRAGVKADRERVEATFEKNGGIRPAALAGSRTCGTTGCHEEIEAEWAPSAHRYASRSAFFQLIQGAMADANGSESTRYCAGCHDPISLFSGAKTTYFDDLSSPGADEGISCAVCHTITQTDLRGNANYVVTPPVRYLAEDSFVGRFLIRAYPRHHKATYSRPLLQTPEFCGACHKQFIDKEINRATRVQLQNQYDGWKGSHWFVPDKDNPRRADPERSLTCRDCHMRLTSSGEPSTAKKGKHRHHGYIAANQWLPQLHKLPGAKKHVELTEQWLRGETVIPEITDRWPGGPPVPLAIEAPAEVRAGENVKLRITLDNKKVGHTFPTGPLDVIQAWVEVRVTHRGKEIFASGVLDKDGFLPHNAWTLKAEGVDRAGNLIDRHNLWDMVGARFRRVLFPGYTDQQEYTFECACEADSRIANPDVAFTSPSVTGELKVVATLRYRKVDQTLLNVLIKDGKARAPVTDMSRAVARIRVVGSEGGAGERGEK